MVNEGNGRRWFAIAGILGAFGVAFGAFSAQGLEAVLRSRGLGPNEIVRRVDHAETAVRYQMIHALALFGIGLAERMKHARWWTIAGIGFTLGILLFSGSLYAMALGAPRWFGMITPFGGAIWIVAWIGFAVQARLAYPRAPEGTR